VGTLTLTQLKAEVKAGLANRNELDARLTSSINLSQERIARIADFEELRTSTDFTFLSTGNASDKYYTLPALREIYSIRITQVDNEGKLVYRTPRLWDQIHPVPESDGRGVPEEYTRWGTKIEIYPLPDANYSATVRWTKWPAPLSDAIADGVSDLDHKDEALIEMTLGYLFYSLGREDEGKRHEARAGALIAESLAEKTEKPDADISVQNTRSVMPSSNYWIDPFAGSAP